MSVSTELWLIRHGETEWSKSGAHTGRTDIALTEHGRAQAVAVGKYLHDTRFCKVLESPMSRARETCVLAGLAAHAEADAGLLEWDYGDAEGKTTLQMRAQYNDPEWQVWTRPIPGGETVEQVGERADGVIERALAGAGEKDKVALFGHAHLLRILAARWLGLPATDGHHFGLDTGSVSVLGWERETRVISHWNRVP